MTKHYTFRCEKLDISIKEEIESLKKKLDCASNNELLAKLVQNYVVLEKITEDKITKLCDKKEYSRQKLLAPVIERYINKTLKEYGVIKEPNKKTVAADEEMQAIIIDVIKYYNEKPKEDRKYLTASMISKFLYKHDDKYSAKHNNVIKRALITHNKIIDEYHKKNGLTLQSNYLNRKSKTN